MTNLEAAVLMANAISTFAAKAALHDAGDPELYGASKAPERTARFALIEALHDLGVEDFNAVRLTRRIQAAPFASMPGLSPLGDDY